MMLLSLLSPALGSSTAFDSLSSRPVDMVGWNPALIVGLRAGSHSRPISAHDRHLISGIHFLAAEGLLRALTSLAPTSLLAEREW